MLPQPNAARVAAVRRFNRFYTRAIGVLGDGLLHSPYSLTEVRLMFELAHRDGLTAATLCRDLNLDPGYVSRTVAQMEQAGLVERVRSDSDGRQRILALTAAGRAAFAPLDEAASAEVAALLAHLPDSEQQRLLGALATVEALLQPDGRAARDITLRDPQPGDMGWVIELHGRLYAQEYGWDATFEALVAQICADFVTHFKPGRERCWIAEVDGQRAGSIFCVQANPDTAKLRLLLLDPAARGLGLGRRLVDEVIQFARGAGYTTLTLWTNDCLHAARRIYETAGFRLVTAEPHHSFGHDLVGENWDLAL